MREIYSKCPSSEQGPYRTPLEELSSVGQDQQDLGDRSKESAIVGDAGKLVGGGHALIPFPGIAWPEFAGEIAVAPL